MSLSKKIKRHSNEFTKTIKNGPRGLNKSKSQQKGAPYTLAQGMLDQSKYNSICYSPVYTLYLDTVDQIVSLFWLHLFGLMAQPLFYID